MAYDNGSRVLKNVYPLMINVTVSLGVCEMMEGCDSVYIDSSRKDNADIMYDVMLPPTYHGPRYLNAPYDDVHFPPSIPHTLNLTGTKIQIMFMDT